MLKKISFLALGIILIFIGGIILFPVGYDIHYNLNASKIVKKIEQEAYSYYCVVNSYSIRIRDNQEIVDIDNHQINTHHKWGNKVPDDGIFVVIFSNDLENAEELITTTRARSLHLFDESDQRQSTHYCKRI